VEVELTKDYRFEAAHFLPRVPAGHKCARVHGHSYKAEIEVRGPVDPATGWLIDFGVIDEAWGELFKLFDHHNLNEVAGTRPARTSPCTSGGRCGRGSRRCRR